MSRVVIAWVAVVGLLAACQASEPGSSSDGGRDAGQEDGGADMGSPDTALDATADPDIPEGPDGPEDLGTDPGLDAEDRDAADAGPGDTAQDAPEDAVEDSADDAHDPDVPPPCQAPLVHGEGEPLATINECGTLSYGLYANQGDQDARHRLPDFSHAGYRRGGVPIPAVPAVLTLEPADGDNRGRIQDAIDRVSAMPRGPDGFRGAVLLRAGTYDVGNSITIGASGVVLRGEGQGRDGTVLRATRREQHDVLVVQGGGSGFGEEPQTRVRIVSDPVAVGQTSFDVDANHDRRPGDVVGVVRTPNDAWIDTLDMRQWGWSPGAYHVVHERRIAAVDGRRITVDVPLVDALETRFGGGAIFRADLGGRVEQVGIEDLRVVSVFRGDTDENHGWKAVKLRRATHSWVRRVTAQHFGYSTVSIEDQSSFNTVEECAFVAPISRVSGGRRYAFNLSGGTGNLFQRCYAEEARHDFVSGARTTGPNVWLDCYSHRSSNDDGPHHRWATGVLLDNAASRSLHVENRQDSGSGHGWSGAQTLFWNGVAGGIRCFAPRGAMNWTIGCMGTQEEGGWTRDEPLGWWESHGSPVDPRSIYLWQLQDRLGPEAVQAVTTDTQRRGRVWAQLARWAGNGRLADFDDAPRTQCEDGLPNGLACCAAGCGTCGGQGCGGRPGGADACCTGAITTSGRSCQVSAPPCILDPDFRAVGGDP